jgi:hypothetical protein
VQKVNHNAEELWFLMHHSFDPRRFALALTCYCDDSGSHYEAKVAVVGATVMNRPRFIEFSETWSKILHEFRIPKVHMQDFIRPYGRHASMNYEMKLALFTSVAKAINSKKAYSLSVAVPQADYRSFFSGGVCRELMGPYAMAFFTTVLLNREICIKFSNKTRRVAYLIDKGSKRHHEQLQAAHTVILQVENSRGENYTGAMAADLDDHNNALQAADVIAWSYHRQLNSGELADEFAPLRSIFRESQASGLPDAVRPHIKLKVPKRGIAIWARMINRWISNNGKTPTWEQLAFSPRRKQ